MPHSNFSIVQPMIEFKLAIASKIPLLFAASNVVDAKQCTCSVHFTV